MTEGCGGGRHGSNAFYKLVEMGRQPVRREGGGQW
jgi:hypothetical protein